MTTTTSPRATSRLTSSRTWSRPKYLWTWLTLTNPESPLGVARQARERIADREVERGHDAEDLEGQECLLHEDLPGPRQLDVAQHRHDRGVLDQPDGQPHRGRDHDADRLGEDDPPHDLEVAEAEGPGAVPLVPADRLDPGPHDLGHKGAAVHDQRGDPGPEDRHLDPQEDRQREEDDVELHEERRVADHLDVGRGRHPQPPAAGSPAEPDAQRDEG